MTTQAELLQLGEAHREKSNAINTVMVSIRGLQVQALQELKMLENRANMSKMALEFQEGYRVPPDNSDLAMLSARLGASMTAMNSSFVTLACLLAQSGVKHRY
jgi:hypothetical protein